MKDVFNGWCVPGICAVLFTMTLAATSFAQTDAPAAWAAADAATAKEASSAYEAAKPAVLKLDYPAMVRTLADGRRPLLPKSRQTDAAVAEMAAKMKAKPKDFERTQKLLADVEAIKPKAGSATTQEATVRDLKVTLVKIPLTGTRELAEKNGMAKGRLTTDDEGNLAVLMVKHEGTWYWNPFGW